ncbi:MAG: enoyl-CoA hydratase-related protein [Vampirovibrionales bacterium]
MTVKVETELSSLVHVVATRVEPASTELGQRAVGWIQLNRPQSLNALCADLIADLTAAMAAFVADDTIGCLVITGNEKAFAAGADLSELAAHTPVSLQQHNPIGAWEVVAHCSKPVVAAVQGFALGGGCELAMMCDCIVAGEGAQFGQPEINLGTIPGAGGTQRLTRLAGKAQAMDIILTGRRFSAAEALAMGLVSRVVADDAVLETAKQMALTIASKPAVALQAAKQAILQADETALQAGLDAERRLFHLTFASADCQEGLQAFAEKRKPVFIHR